MTELCSKLFSWNFPLGRWLAKLTCLPTSVSIATAEYMLIIDIIPDFLLKCGPESTDSTTLRSVWSWIIGHCKSGHLGMEEQAEIKFLLLMLSKTEKRKITELKMEERKNKIVGCCFTPSTPWIDDPFTRIMFHSVSSHASLSREFP